MSNVVTLSEMRVRALDYADMTGSTFPVEARVTDYINDGMAELYDLLVGAFEDYVRSSASVTLVSGTETYALPSDYYKTLKVFYVLSNRRYRVPRFSLSEIDGLKTSPIRAGTLEHWYVPQMSLMTSDSDTVASIIPALPVGWEDFAVLHAAILLLTREESSTVALEKMKESKRRRILAMAEQRDLGEPHAVADEYNRWGGQSAFFIGDQRNLRYRIMGSNMHVIESDGWIV